MPDEKKLSPVEVLKAASNYLRGSIKEQLAQPSSHFEGGDKDLLKSHGTYQQDDRDKRQDLLKQKKEAAFSMMVRSKISGGKLTPAQYLAHDKLATKYGNNTLRITTRQGFQFHGVLKKNVKAVIRGINECLVTTLGACGDNVRNVLACPAPFEDRIKLEIQRYAREVSDQFLARAGAYHEIWLDGENVAHLPTNAKATHRVAPTGGDEIEPIYGKVYLPRKFKIAIAFPEDNCTDIYSNDIGIVPEINRDRSKKQNGPVPENFLTGFNILVGGGFGMTHGIASTYPRLASPLCFVKPEELLAITKAIVLVQRDHGNRADRKHARMKYLIDDKGLDWFRAEVEKRFGKKTEPMHTIHWTGIENHLGWHEQGNGKWFLGIYIENGRILDKGDLRLKSGLRAAIEKFKPEIYLTCQQDILFSGFQENQKKEIEAFLTSFGIKLSNTLSFIRKDAIACPALPTCGLAISESERALPSVIDELEEKVKELGLDQERIMIRMTGCPNGCARPYNAEIAFVGKTAGTYSIYLGGNLVGDRLNFVFKDKVPQAELAKALFPVLNLYKKDRQEGEGFGNFCSRLGPKGLLEAL